MICHGDDMSPSIASSTSPRTPPPISPPISPTISPVRSARARAHAEVRGEILATARSHLAVAGASGLSLRAVARELGMVSSAVYRYVASRDELLTALIVEAYDSLGERAEQAVRRTAGSPPLDRWREATRAIREWAIERPHEYALLYGSPVPGYAAPPDTVVPGTRVSLALVAVVRDAGSAGLVRRTADGAAISVSNATRDALARLRAVGELDLDDGVLLGVLLAWTQLFGLLSFELFGQTRGLVDDHAAFFDDAATAMAVRIGL
jgi:AcrR family transcriptional regulator